MPVALWLTCLAIWVVAIWVAQATSVWIATKLLKRPARFLACIKIAVIAGITGFGTGMWSLVAKDPAMLLAQFIVSLLILAGIVMAIHRATQAGWGRSIAILLISIVVSIPLVIPIFFVARRLLIEAFVLPTNGMSPTLVAGDRFIADKTRLPARWDVVAFRSPQNHAVTYVQRAAGLPGETIEIIDGAVTINGVVQALPRELEGIRFELPPMATRQYTVRGVQGSPVTLGPGEYFMLGDNSMESLDSRLSKPGLPLPSGQTVQAGAIHAEQIVGVGRLRYGSWERLKILSVH